MNDVAASRATGLLSFLDRLWRFLAGPRLTVILLVWLAVVLTLSVIIPQAPPQFEDPVVRSRWIAQFPPSFRPVVERLTSSGIFSLLDSIWLRLPLALLLAHALVALADLSPTIWHRLRSSPGEFNSLGKPIPPLERVLSEPLEDVSQQLISRLEKGGYRALSLPGGQTSEQGRQDFIAWRWRWSWLGLAGIYLGLGLASLGLILAGWLGHAQVLHLEPDNPVPWPIIGAPNLVLDQVTATDDDPLRPTTGRAWMRVLAGVGESRPLAMKVHSGRLLQGMWVTLTGLRPVAEVAALDIRAGQPVLLQPFSPNAPVQERVRVPLTGDPETRFIGVPSQNVTLRVDYQDDTEHEKPALSLSIFRGAEVDPSWSESLDEVGEVAFRGIRYQITFDYNATLRLNNALWWLAVGLGWGMAALSLIVLAVAPPIYMHGSVEEARQDSRIRLEVDALGDKQRHQIELQTFVTSEAESSPSEV